MLLLHQTIELPNTFTKIEYYHDPKFISFNHWIAIPHLEENTLPETRKNEKVLYLNCHSKESKVSNILINSPVAFQNNSDCAILDFSIFATETNDKIFHLSKLPPKKIIQIKFIRKESFSISYSLADTQKLETKTLNIIPNTPIESHASHNFNPKLKSDFHKKF